jgi:VIT1/CCC1 family predicted Fe2+/Mn2+ transporter
MGAKSHSEKHLIARIGWLRAAVLGANDGVLSTGSLILGVAAASTSQSYVGRGVSLDLANQVAEQLMAKDALAAHAKDELGITEATTARPLQAALASAASFAVGAALPLIAVLLSPKGVLSEAVAISSLLFLAALGAVGAKAGGASMLRAIVRVTFWGAMAMVTTAGIGSVFGVLTRL